MQTLIFGVVFQAGSAGFVVSLAMQCSQDLTPFAGETLHEILVVYHLPENCGNFGQNVNSNFGSTDRNILEI